ncbi:MAG: histidine kinase, partial [Myxococcota bacterium]
MASTTVDTTNCDREPVHIPGHVQSHGLLFALHPSTLSIEQVSTNAPEVLGRETAALLGASIDTVLSDQTVAQLRRSVLENSLSEHLRHMGRDSLRDEIWYDVLAHLWDEVLLVELEPVESNVVHRFDMSEIVTRDMELFAACDSSRELTDTVAEEVRRLSGYFRVMIYQFAEDHSGEVIS